MLLAVIRRIVESEMPEAFRVLRELRSHLDYETFCARLDRQSERGYVLYGAFQEEHLVGLIGMRPVESMARGKHLHVDDLVVTEQKRGHGFGRQLLAFAEQFAATNELCALFLDSRKEVMGFYERMGYG